MNRIKYKKVKKLNPVEAAYLAGLIDGEGTMTLTRLSRNKNRLLFVTIDNTDFNLVKWTLDTVRAGKITKKNPSCPNNSLAFVY